MSGAHNTATDDQDPPNNCQDRLVEAKSGTHRSGLQKGACGFQNRACELESSACKLQACFREALVRSREALLVSKAALVDPDQRLWAQTYENRKWAQTCLQQCNGYGFRVISLLSKCFPICGMDEFVAMEELVGAE